MNRDGRPVNIRFLPRDVIRRHHQHVRKHREPTAAPPVALPGDPTADIPRWTIDSGREGLASILTDAAQRGRR